MIIDTHVHTGLFESEEKVVDMSKEIVLESMKLYGIDYAVVSDAACEYDDNGRLLPPELQIPQAESFLKSINFARENEGKIGVMPWIKPATETADARLEELIRTNRDIVVGMKVHPYYSKVAFDSPLLDPYIQLAEKYNLPVVSHTADSEESHAVKVYNMAKKYPKVNFVMAHMGLCTDNQEAIELLGKLPNLYGDTTWVPLESTLQIVERYGSKKIMFGSDNPIDGLHTYHHNPKGEPSLYQRYFHELESLIGKEAYEDIMYRNAIRIFGIKI